MAKSSIAALSMVKNFIRLRKMVFNILAHFHWGGIDRIMYSSESRGKLTDEEIDTFPTSM
jgi:hypothetical protein